MEQIAPLPDDYDHSPAVLEAFSLLVALQIDSPKILGRASGALPCITSICLAVLLPITAGIVLILRVVLSRLSSNSQVRLLSFVKTLFSSNLAFQLPRCVGSREHIGSCLSIRQICGTLSHRIPGSFHWGCPSAFARECSF